MNPLDTIIRGMRILLGLPLNDELISPMQPQSPPQNKQSFDRLSYYLPTGGQTATGTTPISGKTAAISRELLSQIPMGTLIQLPNGQVVRIEDLTAPHIKNTLDLYYSNPNEALYPEQGLMRNVPYQTVGRDTTGLKYNY